MGSRSNIKSTLMSKFYCLSVRICLNQFIYFKIQWIDDKPLYLRWGEIQKENSLHTKKVDIFTRI